MVDLCFLKFAFQVRVVLLSLCINTVSLPYHTVPGPPLNLMALELSSTSINVSWTAPSKRNGILLSYTVYYAIDNVDGSFGNEQSTSVSVLEGVEMQFVILENLIEFTSYRVVVTATTIAGEGERSASVSVTTDPDSASPPIFVNVTVISSSAIEVRFSYPLIPRGEIYGYLIEYGISETNLEMHSSSNLTVLNRTLDTLDDMGDQAVTIDSLLPFTNYVFRVAAYSFSDTPFQIHIGIFSLDTVSVRTNEDRKLNSCSFVFVSCCQGYKRVIKVAQSLPVLYDFYYTLGKGSL